ncbi:MAG: 3'-5' exonuclease [Nonlabens sp.]
MQLNLRRPICFFDLETTGTNISKDRIVEMCIHKVFPDGAEKTYTYRINPTVQIPPETTAVHGITNEMVKDEPTFKEKAHEINNIIKDSDLAGFNSNRFDIPLLAEEMLRANIDFDMGNRNAIDVQNIFHKMEQRTLVAAYKFYCNKDLTDAHSAQADTIATYEVLKGQLERYNELENDMKSLAEFSTRRKPVDFAGMLAYNEQGEECFNFGKHKGKKVVDVLKQEPGYYSWIQNADFPLYTKKVLTSIKLRGFNS